MGSEEHGFFFTGAGFETPFASASESSGDSEGLGFGSVDSASSVFESGPSFELSSDLEDSLSFVSEGASGLSFGTGSIAKMAFGSSSGFESSKSVVWA